MAIRSVTIDTVAWDWGYACDVNFRFTDGREMTIPTTLFKTPDAAVKRAKEIRDLTFILGDYELDALYEKHKPKPSPFAGINYE